jgi:hypothetical protein
MQTEQTYMTIPDFIKILPSKKCFISVGLSTTDIQKEYYDKIQDVFKMFIEYTIDNNCEVYLRTYYSNTIYIFRCELNEDNKLTMLGRIYTKDKCNDIVFFENYSTKINNKHDNKKD